MSGTGKINDFIPLGTTLIREVSFTGPTYFSIQTELDKLKEENKRLQERLKEANDIISIYRIYDDTECGKATEYCKKLGVK